MERPAADIYSISDFWGYPPDGSWAPKTQDYGNVSLPEPGTGKKTAEEKEITRQVTENKGASKVPLFMVALVVFGLWALAKV